MSADLLPTEAKRRGPKPKGDRPMTGAERARLHRERTKATSDSLASKGFVSVPLVIHAEDLSVLQEAFDMFDEMLETLTMAGCTEIEMAEVKANRAKIKKMLEDGKQLLSHSKA